jgi:hypothetical protein
MDAYRRLGGKHGPEQQLDGLSRSPGRLAETQPARSGGGTMAACHGGTFGESEGHSLLMTDLASGEIFKLNGAYR